MQRRHFLAGMALPVLGCDKVRDITGGFTGQNAARGHLLRERKTWPAPSQTVRTRVVIAGGGVAGLAAARSLGLQGLHDFALLDLEDQAGGNSRGTLVKGFACPMGAHYLPVPSDAAPDVQNLLEELGLRKRVSGRWIYDERHLCHSPQERLFFEGEWQDGLLPLRGVGRETLLQYQSFAALVAQVRTTPGWTIPAPRLQATAKNSALLAHKTISFALYLAQNGLTDSHLLWYLNYCCNDDYGAGIATVSAWAGLHYFASRHGFSAPRPDGQDAAQPKEAIEPAEREGVLTWPEGNGWLTRQLVLPLKERLHTNCLVVRIAAVKHGVEVDAFNPNTQTTQRWVAEQCIVALPIFVANRVIESPPDFLRQAATATRYAPWLVANIHIDAALNDPPGAPPSWDNVIHLQADNAKTGHAEGAGLTGQSANGTSLGYVNAMHQSLQSVPGPTVLTHYRSLGDVPHGRKLLLDKSWSDWRDVVLADLSIAHPDLADKTTHIDITRYGHAMAVPLPLPAPSLQEQSPNSLRAGPLVFAHSDWAGYSVFEEAFSLGHAAGRQAK